MVTEPGYKSNPVFSPDGSRIAFHWVPVNGQTSGIYTQVIGAGGPPLLLAGPGSSPAWSRDGRLLSFYRDDPAAQSRQLLVVSALGGPVRTVSRVALLGPEPFNSSQVWTADGQWILARDREAAAGPSHLAAISVESGDKRRLTSPAKGTLGDFAPALSPDGRTLAFVRMSTYAVADIYVQPLSSPPGGVAQLARLTQLGWQILDLLWSGDSRDVLLSAFQDGVKRLWRVSLARPGAIRIVSYQGPIGFHMAISTRGDRLAYREERSDDDIWRQNLPAPGEKASASSGVVVMG